MLRFSTYLPLLLLSSLLANAAPIELAGEGLTESTWDVVDKDVWRVLLSTPSPSTFAVSRLLESREYSNKRPRPGPKP